MELKKHYNSPSIDVIKVESTSMLQTSTGAEIPDSGWGAKMRTDDIDEEEFSNLIGILSILQQ